MFRASPGHRASLSIRRPPNPESAGLAHPYSTWRSIMVEQAFMQRPAMRSSAHFLRLLVIAVISFLTLVDLFATQAILPSLARAYQVSPAVIGSAVNICTLGMAAAGLVVAWFNRLINRRLGVTLCLAALAIPT